MASQLERPFRYLSLFIFKLNISWFFIFNIYGFGSFEGDNPKKT